MPVFREGDAVGAHAAWLGRGLAVSIGADAVEAARDDPRRGGFADAANAGEQERMRDALARKRIAQRAHQHLLTDEIGEGLWAVFTG